MTRKELNKNILLLIETTVVDPGRKETLTTGVNDLFVAYGKAWLRRNAKNIVYVIGQAGYLVPRLLKFIKR